jgi:hypothetical protein
MEPNTFGTNTVHWTGVILYDREVCAGIDGKTGIGDDEWFL